MKTIEVDDGLYEYLRRNTVRIGETASDILRRLLHLTGPGENGGEASRRVRRGSKNHDTGGGVDQIPTELSKCLNSPGFLAQPDVIGKFLFILGYLHTRDPDKFKDVLEISGRKRKYFALTSAELEQSGKSVNPQRIPESQYWVVTNNDTSKKRRILADVLRVLGYAGADVELALRALR